ncbi:hypothetical protein Pfo_015621 [Paulownia fortunei]|nr:hypothetical protein Pfo_015621 [Paulownia fortunei]
MAYNRRVLDSKAIRIQITPNPALSLSLSLSLSATSNTLLCEPRRLLLRRQQPQRCRLFEFVEWMLLFH